MLPRLLTLTVIAVAAATAACTPTRDPAAEDAQTAQAFYARNHTADFSPFEGVTVRVVRPVVRRDADILGHVFAVSFCKEVVDVSGYRAQADLTFTYSDWPSTQETLLRRTRRDSVGRQQLAELFRVPPAQARATFAHWADSLTLRFKALDQPHGPAGAQLRTLRACVSDEGHPVLLELASGLRLFYLPPDTENSIFWTKERRSLNALGPHWYWRRPAPTALSAEDPTGGL